MSLQKYHLADLTPEGIKLINCVKKNVTEIQQLSYANKSDDSILINFMQEMSPKNFNELLAEVKEQNFYQLTQDTSAFCRFYIHTTTESLITEYLKSTTATAKRAFFFVFFYYYYKKLNLNMEEQAIENKRMISFSLDEKKILLDLAKQYSTSLEGILLDICDTIDIRNLPKIAKKEGIATTQTTINITESTHEKFKTLLSNAKGYRKLDIINLYRDYLNKTIPLPTMSEDRKLVKIKELCTRTIESAETQIKQINRVELSQETLYTVRENKKALEDLEPYLYQAELSKKILDIIDE
ncbi:MAG: hypothetical protein ACRC0X_02035 [Brevinema sp.]